jgi:hypothetical protein
MSQIIFKQCHVASMSSSWLGKHVVAKRPHMHTHVEAKVQSYDNDTSTCTLVQHGTSFTISYQGILGVEARYEQ